MKAIFKDDINKEIHKRLEKFIEFRLKQLLHQLYLRRL